MQKKFARGLALLLAFALLFGGCVKQEEPVFAPEPTPSPESTPAPMFVLGQLELRQGERRLLTECFSSDFVPEGAVAFRSSDESVVSVDDQGELIAKAQGEAVVSAAYGESQDEITVVVKGVLEAPNLHIQINYLALAPGETGSLSCSVTEGIEGEPLWSTNDEAVATVDNQGNVTAVGKGTARVTARVGEYEDSVAVWVTGSKPHAPLSEIKAPRFSAEEGVLKNAEASDTGKASILLTGDLMVLSSQQYAAKSGKTYNYNSSFKLVRPIFAKGDFVMGNLETCLSYSNPYTAEEKTVQDNPNCNAQATFLDALRYAGYDAVATANNHCGDTGTMGLYETVQMLDTYRLAHTGTFTRAGEQRFLLAEINGIQVAFLSYTEIINTKYGNLAIPDAQKSILLNKYSEEKVQRDVAAAREAGAEFVIAYNHWGMENTHDYTKKQVEHAQQMADAGVDFIAGSHSHCLQPPKMFTASDGRQVPCIFSMGNFVSGMGRDINNDTVILKLDLVREGEGVALKSVGYIPCRVFVEYGDGHHVVVPTSSALNGGKTGPTLTAARERIVKVMGNDVFQEIKELG